MTVRSLPRSLEDLRGRRAAGWIRESTAGQADNFYVGRLWLGEQSALGALIDPGTWEHVQSLRARYSRRHRGSLTRRQYGLAGLLACAACGRHLIGRSPRETRMLGCRDGWLRL
jgi:hypothetical protein